MDAKELGAAIDFHKASSRFCLYIDLVVFGHPSLLSLGIVVFPELNGYVTLMLFRTPFFLLSFVLWLGACVLLLRLVLVSHTCPGVWDNRLTASFQEAAVSDRHKINALQVKVKVSVAPGYHCWTAGAATAMWGECIDLWHRLIRLRYLKFAYGVSNTHWQWRLCRFWIIESVVHRYISFDYNQLLLSSQMGLSTWAQNYAYHSHSYCIHLFFEVKERVQ